jgi:hypothetical protein
MLRCAIDVIDVGTKGIGNPAPLISYTDLLFERLVPEESSIH